MRHIILLYILNNSFLLASDIRFTTIDIDETSIPEVVRTLFNYSRASEAPNEAENTPLKKSFAQQILGRLKLQSPESDELPLLETPDWQRKKFLREVSMALGRFLGTDTEQDEKLLSYHDKRAKRRGVSSLEITGLSTSDLVFILWCLTTQFDSNHRHASFFHIGACSTQIFDQWRGRSAAGFGMRDYCARDFVLSLQLITVHAAHRGTRSGYEQDAPALECHARRPKRKNIDPLNFEAMLQRELDEKIEKSNFQTVPKDIEEWVVAWLHCSQDDLDDLPESTLEGFQADLLRLPLSQEFYGKGVTDMTAALLLGQSQILTNWCAKWCKAMASVSPEKTYDHEYVKLMLTPLNHQRFLSDKQKCKIHRRNRGVLARFPLNHTRVVLYSVQR